MKELLETNKAVKISLFLLTMLATAMVISDAILTPAISGKIFSTLLFAIILSRFKGTIKSTLHSLT